MQIAFTSIMFIMSVVFTVVIYYQVPATREILGSLPNVFSALCLNTRGLSSFVRCDPFDRLFKVLLSPVYLAAMRRRRSSDPMGDTASNLGNAMDELMRHQPSLKVDATFAIIKVSVVIFFHPLGEFVSIAAFHSIFLFILILSVDSCMSWLMHFI